MMMTYASCVETIVTLTCGRGIGRGWGWGWSRGRRFDFGRAGSGFAQNLEHNGAASRAFALNRLAPVLHCFFDAIVDLFFGFALNAISFGHKNFTIRASCPNGLNSLTKPVLKRNPEKNQSQVILDKQLAC